MALPPWSSAGVEPVNVVMPLSHLKLPRALVGALLAAVAAHGVGSWWLMTQGWQGRSGGVLPKAAPMAGALPPGDKVDLGDQGRRASDGGQDAILVRLQLAEVPRASSLTSARRELSEPGDAEPVSGFGEAISHGGRMGAVQTLEATSGDAPLLARYLPTDELDHPPTPEPGWLLDESAFEGILRARLVLRLWVSSQGRIDRVVLVQAEPAGAWAGQAIRPLSNTRMLPGLIGRQPVSSIIVVEIAANDEGFR